MLSTPPLPSSTPTAYPSTAAEADRLTRLVQRAKPSTRGRITASLGPSASRYANTSVHTTLLRRGDAPLPALAVASEEHIAAVGELTSSEVDDISAWDTTAARTFIAILAAHEANGTFLGWMALGNNVARAVLLDGVTIALEVDIAFLTTNPRVLPAHELLSKTAPHLPADERRLTEFLTTALALLSFPSIPPLAQTVAARLLSPPRPPLPIPAAPAPRRRTRAPGTPPRYSPPRMAIADLSTPPRSTSPQKRSSPGGGSPGKRPAIDVHAWRSGKSGAALFDFDPDRCPDEGCCSPTELDTPPPSASGEVAEKATLKPARLALQTDATIRPRAGALQAEETARPGTLVLQADKTVRPGTLTLQPAWEEAPLANTPTMPTSSQRSDNAARLKSLSLQSAEDSPRRSLGPQSGSLVTASAMLPSATVSSKGKRLGTAGKKLELQDYLAVLAERKVRVVLVSSTEMDGAVEGIRAAHS